MGGNKQKTRENTSNQCCAVRELRSPMALSAAWSPLPSYRFALSSLSSKAGWEAARLQFKHLTRRMNSVFSPVDFHLAHFLFSELFPTESPFSSPFILNLPLVFVPALGQFSICCSSMVLPTSPHLPCEMLFFFFFRFQDFLLYGWYSLDTSWDLFLSLALGHVHISVFKIVTLVYP